jgi:hypothetical protein
MNNNFFACSEGSLNFSCLNKIKFTEFNADRNDKKKFVKK